VPEAFFRGGRGLFLFLFVAEVGGGEEADDGNEDVDEAFDALDGEHGDSFEDNEEAEGGEEAAEEEVRALGVDNQFYYGHQEDKHMITNHYPNAGDGGEVVGDAGSRGSENHDGDNPAPFAPMFLGEAHTVALVGDDVQKGVEQGIGCDAEHGHADEGPGETDDLTLAEPADADFFSPEVIVFEEWQVAGEAVVVDRRHSQP